MNNQKAFASNNLEKGSSILRSNTIFSKPKSNQLITVYPTYGQYFTGYVLTPMVALMVVGAGLGIWKLSRAGGSAKQSDKPTGGIAQAKQTAPKKKKKMPKFDFSKLKGKGKGLMAGIGGLKGGRRK